MKRRLSFSNITFKLVLFLALVSVFPLLVLGITSYTTSRTVIQEEVSSYTLALMIEQKNYLELILEQVESLITNISGVEDIRSALDDEGQYDPGDTYTRLSTHAQIGYILSGYVSLKGLVSIDIFTPGGAHYHVGDTLNVQEINQEVLDRIYAEALASNKLVLWTGAEDNVNTNSTHRKVVTAAKLFGKVDIESLQEKPAAILLVNYSVDSLHDHFSQLILGEGAYMIIVDTKERMIFHPDKRLIGSQVSSAFLAHLAADEGSFVTEVAGQEMFVTYSKSEASNWSSISLVPLKNLTANANTIRNTTLLILGLSFVFITLSTVWVSRTMVEPIKRITELFKQTQAGTIDWQMRFTEKRTDEIGELLRWFNAFLDSLEARRQVERELVAAETANQAKSQLLATVSHELRTPLGAILGYSEFLQEGAFGSVSTQQQEILYKVIDSTHYLAGLVGQLLDQAQIAAGKTKPNIAPFALQEMVAQVENRMSVLARSKGLILTTEVAADMPAALSSDEQRLQQILINLVGNAIKFTPPGGRVQVRVQRSGADHWAMQVADTGPGISPKMQERIFEPFRQVDGSITRQHRGVGLGLSIVKQFAALMGGEVILESEIGQGSTFSVLLPLTPQEDEYDKTIGLDY